MQACLGTGAYCMIDIHNFARFNGDAAIIGQGGPPDEQFVSLWTQLATKYKANDKVVFELMNEPHHLDVPLWAATCQKVVTAIRNAGAASQMILLPGTNFDSAATLVSSGSADALMAITNPDGSTDNLLLDIHKYLDIDNSGTHAECTTDNVGNFTIVAEYLRGKGRKGLVSETGASSQASCMTAFCAQNTFINANPDVFVGLVAWGAGSFDSGYVLSLTPKKQGNGFVDNALMSQCVVKTWVDSEGVQPPPPPASTSPAPTGPSTGGAPAGAPTGSPTGTPTGAPTGPPAGNGGSRPSPGTLSSAITGITMGATFLTGGQASAPTATGTSTGLTPFPNAASHTTTIVKLGVTLLLAGILVSLFL
jgi:endoglucanase